MRYHGINTRDYLILEHIPLGRDKSVMEIGVGSGSALELIIDKVGKFCGIDISREAIDDLLKIYADKQTTTFYAIDVCQESSTLPEKFDIIFSADTLEHVEKPQSFFTFIRKHLNQNSIAVVTFPNESEELHHGITWFNSREKLMDLIENTGLTIAAMCEVKKTLYHRIIETIFFRFPKYIILRLKGLTTKNLPQCFQETNAFKINKRKDLITYLFASYAKAITRIASLHPFIVFEMSDEDIRNKRLLIKLKIA